MRRRVKQCVLNQPFEVDAVEGEQVADDVIHAPLQRGLHRLQLRVQPFEQLPLDCVGGAEVEDVAVVLLADPVHPAHPLLKPDRVPRQVVVDHQVAELKVDPFPAASVAMQICLFRRKSCWIFLRSVGGWPPWIVQTV